MYIRFVVSEVDAQSRRRRGVLVAAHQMVASEQLDELTRAEVEGLIRWSSKHLRIPSALGHSEHYRALSWFKPNATKPIATERIDVMWQLTHQLRASGVLIEVLKTNAPGSFLFEDKWQLVAKLPKGKKLGW